MTLKDYADIGALILSVIALVISIRQMIQLRKDFPK